MIRISVKLLAVFLISTFTALPSLGQVPPAASAEQGTLTFAETVCENQYGPFLHSERFSTEQKITNHCDTSAPMTPFNQFPSAANHPQVATKPPVLTHQLDSLWRSVEPKKQSADSPWVDVK